MAKRPEPAQLYGWHQANGFREVKLDWASGTRPGAEKGSPIFVGGAGTLAWQPSQGCPPIESELMKVSIDNVDSKEQTHEGAARQ